MQLVHGMINVPSSPDPDATWRDDPAISGDDEFHLCRWVPEQPLDEAAVRPAQAEPGTAS